MFENIREKVKNFREERDKRSEEKYMARIEEDSQRRKKIVEKDIDKIKNRPGFKEDISRLCLRFGMSEEEIDKAMSEGNFRKKGLFQGVSYNAQERTFVIEISMEEITEYIRSEMPKEIFYRPVSMDDFSSYGDYMIDVTDDIVILYSGYVQSGRYESELDFIPKQYKEERVDFNETIHWGARYKYSLQ